MAQKVITTLVDDLTDEELQDGAGTTVHFGFDGNNYEIDLSNDNAEKFREALSDYIAAARKVGARTSRPTSSGSASKPRGNADDLAKIREWANANGYEVSTRGRIAQSVRDAYDAAH
jgi:hypothetical protein